MFLPFMDVDLEIPQDFKDFGKELDELVKQGKVEEAVQRWKTEGKKFVTKELAEQVRAIMNAKVTAETTSTYPTTE